MVVDEMQGRWSVASDHCFMRVTLRGQKRGLGVGRGQKGGGWNLKVVMNWRPFREAVEEKVNRWWEELLEGEGVVEVAYRE